MRMVIRIHKITYGTYFVLKGRLNILLCETVGRFWYSFLKNEKYVLHQTRIYHTTYTQQHRKTLYHKQFRYQTNLNVNTYCLYVLVGMYVYALTRHLWEICR